MQPGPDGLAQAFFIREEFSGKNSCSLILGNNIFFGEVLGGKRDTAVRNVAGAKATISVYYVNDLERFGIMDLIMKLERFCP